MNWTPTALFVALIIIIAVFSLFGGYFGFANNNIFGIEIPSGVWGILTSAIIFYASLLLFSVEGLPWIFSVIWWILNIIAVYILVKTIWPGA